MRAWLQRQWDLRDDVAVLREYRHTGGERPGKSCWWPSTLWSTPALWCWRCVWREVTGQRRRAHKAWVADVKRRSRQMPVVDLRPYIGHMDQYVKDCRRATEEKP